MDILSTYHEMGVSCLPQNPLDEKIIPEAWINFNPNMDMDM